jgi:hypothetical protein
VSPEKLDLVKLKAMTYEPVDWIARIRTSSNSLAWLPVFINVADRLEYVTWYGQWRIAASIQGFEEFEEVKPMPTKKLYNPHRKDLVDTGIPVDEFKELREEWNTLVQ